MPLLTNLTYTTIMFDIHRTIYIEPKYIRAKDRGYGSEEQVHEKKKWSRAALRVVREKGIDGLTAKTMADALGTSTQPVFTCFGSWTA